MLSKDRTMFFLGGRGGETQHLGRGRRGAAKGLGVSWVLVSWLWSLCEYSSYEHLYMLYFTKMFAKN